MGEGVRFWAVGEGLGKANRGGGEWEVRGGDLGGGRRRGRGNGKGEDWVLGGEGGQGEAVRDGRGVGEEEEGSGGYSFRVLMTVVKAWWWW